MKYNQAYTDFSFGEVSEKVRARIDTDAYKKGVRRLENFMPLPTGGVTRRPGTIISALALPDLPDYCSSFTYKLPSGEIATIFCYFFTYDSGGNFYTKAEVVWVTQPIIGTYTTLTPSDYLANQTNIRIDLNVSIADGTKFHGTQVGKNFYITHASGEVPPMVIVYNTTTLTPSIYWWFDSTLITSVDFNAFTTPFEAENQDTNVCLRFESLHAAGTNWKRNPTGELGNIFVETSAGVAIDTFFGEDLVGSIFRIIDAGDITKEAVIQIVNTTATANKMQFRYLVNNGGTARTSYWKLNSWNFRLGFPKTVTASNSRLCFGGSIDKPDFVWCSGVSSLLFFNSQMLLQDRSASTSYTLFTFFDGIQLYNSQSLEWPFNFRPASTQHNNIKWLVGGSSLFIGTDGLELSAKGVNGVFSVESLEVKMISSFGGSEIFPCIVNDGLVYVSRDKKRLIKLNYSEISGEFSFKELSFLNQEIVNHNSATTQNYIQSILWLEEDKHVLCLTTNNEVIGISLTDGDAITSWFRYTFGNSGKVFALGKTISNNREISFFYTERYSTKIFETSENFYPQVDNKYLDGIVSPVISLTPETDWSLGIYYANQTVDVVGNSGTIYEDILADASGDIILPSTELGIVAGFPYTSTLRTLPIEAGAQFGAAAGSITRIHGVNLMLYQTNGVTFGSDQYGLEDAELSEFPFTGDLKVDFPVSPDNINEVWLVEDRPKSLTVLGMVIHGVTNA